MSIETMQTAIISWRLAGGSWLGIAIKKVGHGV